MASFLVARGPDMLEKLNYAIVIMACVADVAGSEGMAYTVAAAAYLLLGIDARNFKQVRNGVYFCSVSLAFDIAFLAQWATDRGSAVAVFGSFIVIAKIGAVFYGRQFLAELQSADGPVHLGAKLASEGGDAEAGAADSSAYSAGGAGAGAAAGGAGGYQGSYQSG